MHDFEDKLLPLHRLTQLYFHDDVTYHHITRWTKERKTYRR